MIQTQQIKPNIFIFKAIGYTDLDFHGSVFRNDEGASYNSYLIIDEQITLIDTMDEHLAEEFIRRLEKVLDGRKLDNIIVNHVEPDHSGSYEAVKALYPDAKSFCSAMAEKAMKSMYFGEHEYEVVKNLETLTIGKYTLKFILTPFIHWPDNMVTYLEEEKILFSNDAFGSLVASNKMYDDEYEVAELMRHAKEYYANIVMPCSRFVMKKLKEINELNLEFDLICPSHGIIWKKHITEIMDQYMKWATFSDIKHKVVMVYDTIWGNTELVTNEIAVGLAERGYEVRVFKAGLHRPALIMSEIMDAKAILVGSSNFNNAMVGPIADILERIYALSPQNKVGMVYGSYGWANAHLKRVESRLEEAKIELIESAMYENYKPDIARLKYAEELGMRVAEKIDEKYGNNQ